MKNRKIKIAYPVWNREKDKYIDKEIEGIFFALGVISIEERDNIYIQESSAIVELPNGEIINCTLDKIRFIDYEIPECSTLEE